MIALCLALVAIDPRADFKADQRHVATLPEYRLVAELDHPRYWRREAADRELRRRGPEGYRLARIGAASSNPEVSARCARIVADRHACAHCDGTGECERQRRQHCEPCKRIPGDRWDFTKPNKCLFCNGSGDSRDNPPD